MVGREEARRIAELPPRSFSIIIGLKYANFILKEWWI
jgi:hypothetical protein